MFRFLLALIVISLAACKTPAALDAQSGIYDGSAPKSEDGAISLSKDDECNRFGGEMIQGTCICADGTPKERIKGAAHCAAWIKSQYPDCYAKGGMPKAFGGGEQLCVCPHGEALEGGRQTCFDLFKERYPECGRKGGIVLANDSICRCLHGKPALGLSGTCEDDFKQENERCADKFGVTSEGSACRCRDGSIVDTDEKAKCSEPWFFYAYQGPVEAERPDEQTAESENNEPEEEATANNESTNTAEESSTPNRKVNCMCQHHQGNCVIYKPGDTKSMKWVQTTAANCTRNFCYKNFSDVIFAAKTEEDGKGGCGGLWDYKATMTAASETNNTVAEQQQPDISKFCVCRKLRNQRPVGCGLFLPGKNQPNTWMNTADSCNPDRCVAYFGNSYTLKTHCYDATSKKYLWRHQD